MRTQKPGLTAAVLGLAAVSLAGAGDPGSSSSIVAGRAKVDPWVRATGAAGPTEFLVLLAEQADLSGAKRLRSKEAKGRFVYERLAETARRTQEPLLALLSERGIEHQPFWVANMIRVRGDLSLAEELAGRDDVAYVHANPTVRFEPPVLEDGGELAPEAVEPGVARVRAPEVWSAGFTGQTVVVGGQDTGYDWDHPALMAKYRGWNGTSADHNYNWHDAIHGCTPGAPPPCGGTCGIDSAQPCDDTNHGTHTMGTMVGDDGGSNQVGVAPGARWMGCRNMDRGNGTPATYSECFQWFIAPTDLSNQNPDPTRAPHVINNSWSCPASEGCTTPDILLTVVNNTRAAGILVVVSAGNSGSACSTVNTPAAIYQSSFSVGATNVVDVIASFSSRGPVTVDGSNRLKPNVSAPGVSVRSSVPIPPSGTGYGTMSGTSMAGPHVVGVAALLMSVDPPLKGQVGVLETTLQGTALGLTTTQTCGGVPGDTVPNNTYGHGRVDAFEAGRTRTADVALVSTAWPGRTKVGRPLNHSLTVSNAGPLAAAAVVVTQVLPAGFGDISVTPSQGACGVNGTTITCALGSVGMGGSAVVQVRATPGTPGAANSQATAASGQPDLSPANNVASLQTRVARCEGVSCP